jgi:hypothetical protein
MSLKQKCLSKPGNLQLWLQVKEQGRSISLISGTEAAKLGGKSAISEQESEEVRQLFCFGRIRKLNVDEVFGDMTLLVTGVLGFQFSHLSLHISVYVPSCYGSLFAIG